MVDVKRPILFSGENPGMTLFSPDTEETVAVASYWHCTDSPMGVGHALVLWLKNENAAIGHGGIFTDSLKLAEVLIRKLTQHFPEFENVPVQSLQYIHAHCGHTYDGTSYRATCQISAAQVELEWSDPLDRKQILWPGFPAGEEGSASWGARPSNFPPRRSRRAACFADTAVERSLPAASSAD